MSQAMRGRSVLRRAGQGVWGGALAVFAAGLMPVAARAQNGPPPGVRRTIDRVVDMVESRGDDALRMFADSALSPSYRKSFSGSALLEHLREVRDAGRGHGGSVAVDLEDDGALMLMLGGEQGAHIRLRLDDDALLTLLEAAPTERADSPPGPPRNRDAAIRAHVSVLEGLSRLAPDEARAALVRDHLTPSFVRQVGDEKLHALVALIRKASASAQDITLNEEGEGLVLELQGLDGARVHFQVESAAPFRITELSADETRGGPMHGPAAEPLAWDDLSKRFDQAADSGFSGVVLARHGGRAVLDRTYGAADRASGRPIRTNTIFGIGSTPIDFTITAALLLAQEGQLSLSDSIGRFLDGVPPDKAGMTLDMILSGRSGLPDFHDTPDDWDPDLAWIDRGTAVRRILARPLVFPPGTDDLHSHSAYVLLAAIIERATGQSYREFVRSRILAPLGMSRTGFYGESLGLTPDDFAVGYGTSSVGVPNIPPNWGPTSWLVMGSGGMFSTLGDMRRYYDGMRNGALLHGEWVERYRAPRVGVGGSERGFFFFRADNGQGDSVILLMNGEGRTPGMQRLTQGLIGMVMGSR